MSSAGTPRPTMKRTRMSGVAAEDVRVHDRDRHATGRQPGRAVRGRSRGGARRRARAPRRSTISLMLVWNPSQTWGTARRKSSGLKNACRNFPTLDLLRAASDCLSSEPGTLSCSGSHFVWSLPSVPFAFSFLIALIDERLQLAALLHHRAVALARDDLTDDAAVRALLLLALRDDDRHVEDRAPGSDRASTASNAAVDDAE